MSLYHLGSRVSALVDGELAPEAAERALAHAAACPECRWALEAERAARRAVRSADDLAPSDELTLRLLALPAARPGSPAPAGMAVPGHVPPPRSHRAVRWLVVTGGAAVAAVGGLIALGGATSPVVDPSDLRAAPAEAASVEPPADDGADLTATTLAWLDAHGWLAPAAVPAGLEVVDVAVGVDQVWVELADDGGAHVVLTERHGRLPDGLERGESVVVGDTQALLLETSPWTAALQSDDLVLVVVGEPDPAAGRAVLAGLPVSAPAADGAIDRLGRGWDAVRRSLQQAFDGVGAPA